MRRRGAAVSLQRATLPAYNRERRLRGVNHEAPDHSPTCPRCHDLCEPGAKKCQCGGRL